MKVSEITVENIADYLVLDEGDYDPEHLKALKMTAVKYISSYTGLNEEELDEHEDFYIVVMILTQDMHDNRALYVDGKNLNRTVETILNMHCRNRIA